MTNHVDLGTMLRQTLSANLYSNLVTRPTGAAVRNQIETLLQASDRSLTVIDFSHVSMIDFSCADEVIAKLVMSGHNREAYFVFRGMTEDHWDAIESVLERHGLALVVEGAGGVELVGVLDDTERRAFHAIKRRGRAESWELASDLGEPEAALRNSLDRMWRRRLIMRQGEAYTVVGELTQ
jgi:anti-anti-sigma regulatory factor